MFDLQQIKGAGLEEAVRQMPAAVVIAEAPSGKIILVNEYARRMAERNLGPWRWKSGRRDGVRVAERRRVLRSD